MLPSFAVLPLSTNNGATQGDGSGQGSAQDSGATAIAGQQGAQGSAAFALSAGASNAAALLAAQAAAAANAASAQAGIAADSARQAAANAITAGAAARNAADALASQAAATAVPGQAAGPAGAGPAPAVSTGQLAAQIDSQSAAALKGDSLASTSGKLAKAGADSTPGAPATDAPAFRNLMAAGAGAQNSDTIKLAGSPEQWQQPLRSALGERLQLQLQRNNEHAVIRLEPPNMGSIEISIRHSAGALQVNLSASNSDVLRQLNNIGDSMRQDLSQRQFTEVAVTVSASAGRSLADNGGGGRQEREQQERGPGRALNEGDDSPATFAMNERE
ncbi:flagellar hook-length control protein FliK [Pseudoduganella sp. UC29_106]|uniref:flagellar hook-length control protein FliK n=1 Tax=Pseudoduganella sp. UC29_106 TaxID=3374553 RepID=UPI00375708B1